MKLFKIIVVSLLLISAVSSQALGQKGPSRNDICLVLKQFPDNLTYVKNNFPKIVKTVITGDQEDCLFKLVDSITNRAITEHQLKYLECFDVICKSGDGDLGEYLEEKTTDLFYKNFEGLINFLLLNKKNEIEFYLINTLCYDIKSNDSRGEFENYLQDKIKKGNFTGSQIAFIRKLKTKILTYNCD